MFLQQLSHSFTFSHRTSIQAQKVVDAFAQPEFSVTQLWVESRTQAGPMHGIAIADLKHSVAGTPSTFAAADYYTTKSKQRRDELLAKYSPA